MLEFKKVRPSIPTMAFQTRSKACALMRYAVCLAVAAAMSAAVPAWAVDYGTPLKISTTPYNDWGIDGNRAINNQGQVLWVGDDSNNSLQIYLYDGSETSNISNNSTNNAVDYEVLNDNGCAAWTASWTSNSMNFDVWYYCNGAASKITNLDGDTPMSAVLGDLNDSGVIVYYGITDTAYSGLIEYPGDTLIAGEDIIGHPRLNNAGQIVYTDNNYQLHLLSGASDQVISTTPVYGEFDINDNGQVAWETYASSSLQSQIYFYDGHTTKIISTNSGENDFHARGELNANGDVLWLGPATDGSSGRDIYLYSGGVTRAITSNGNGDGWPQMNDNDQIVWAGYDSYYSPCIYFYSGGVIQEFPYGTSNWPVINNQGKIAYISLDDHQVYLLSPVTSGLWQNATSQGGGWYYLSPFGFLNISGSPWIFHSTLGWLYAVGTSTDSIWFYDPQWDGQGGWWWTSSSVFPWVYSVNKRAWLMYDTSITDARWFYNSSTGQWATH